LAASRYQRAAGGQRAVHAAGFGRLQVPALRGHQVGLAQAAAFVQLPQRQHGGDEAAGGRALEPAPRRPRVAAAGAVQRHRAQVVGRCRHTFARQALEGDARAAQPAFGMVDDGTVQALLGIGRRRGLGQGQRQQQRQHGKAAHVGV
jgi:hypothetical protein